MFILKFRALNTYNFGVDYINCDNEESVITFIENKIKEHGDVFEVYSIYEVSAEYRLVSKGLSLEKVCVDKKPDSNVNDCNRYYCDRCASTKNMLLVYHPKYTILCKRCRKDMGIK